MVVGVRPRLWATKGTCSQGGADGAMVLNLCEESTGEDRSLRYSKREAAPVFSDLRRGYSTVTLAEDVLLLQLAHRVRLISDGRETS